MSIEAWCLNVDGLGYHSHGHGVESVCGSELKKGLQNMLAMRVLAGPVPLLKALKKGIAGG
jgi:hypothetical protein